MNVFSLEAFRWVRRRRRQIPAAHRLLVDPMQGGKEIPDEGLRATCRAGEDEDEPAVFSVHAVPLILVVWDISVNSLVMDRAQTT